MAHNRYFIIDSNDKNIIEIISLCVGNLDTQRPNFARPELVVKLKEGDHENYNVLKKYKEYDNSQIIIALDNPEWKKDDKLKDNRT